MQGTQVALAAWQTGVAPVHFVALVAEHWPHEPPGWQAGAELGHSASVKQARQLCAAVLQTGLGPLHWASARHCTHAPAGV
jgi:hypothetical protein